MDGIINIYKEKGMTSFDVVFKLRKILGIRKIGHTGTLDPDATGVLPVCIGKGTKVVDLLTNDRKSYKATMELGYITDTQDISGKVLERFEKKVTQEEVKEAIQSFIGLYHQIPPMYSALKVNGKKLYEYAREGKTVERKPRPVEIFWIEDIEHIEGSRYSFHVSCSKGTYIRTLIQDIGEKLGTGGCMTELERTSVGSFTLENAQTLAEVKKYKEKHKVEEILLPIEQVFTSIEAITFEKKWRKELYNGSFLPFETLGYHVENDKIGVEYKVFDDIKQFIGIYEVAEKHNMIGLKPKKMFLMIDERG